MPMILLAIRVQMEILFKGSYPKFMSNKDNEIETMRLINGIITQMLDPNLYYSRFSFLESGKEALDIKLKMKKPPDESKKKFYARSPLVESLVPHPSEGRVRALFSQYQNPYQSAGSLNR